MAELPWTPACLSALPKNAIRFRPDVKEVLSKEMVTGH